MSPLAVQLMLKRRLRAAGLPKILSPHSFRVLVVTDLLSPRTCRSRTSSTWPGTPTPAPPRSMTGAGGASPATSSSGSPSESFVWDHSLVYSSASQPQEAERLGALLLILGEIHLVIWDVYEDLQVSRC